jgi:hypothetical protein
MTPTAADLAGFCYKAMIECDRIDAEADYEALAILLPKLDNFHNSTEQQDRFDALREANLRYDRERTAGEAG